MLAVMKLIPRGLSHGDHLSIKQVCPAQGINLGNRALCLALSDWLSHKMLRYCCSLNNLAPIGSGSTRGCGLVGVAMTLLEEACHWGWALRSQMLKPCSVWLSLPAAWGFRCRSLSSFRAPSLPACCLASSNDNKGRNL